MRGDEEGGGMREGGGEGGRAGGKEGVCGTFPSFRPSRQTAFFSKKNGFLVLVFIFSFEEN